MKAIVEEGFKGTGGTVVIATGQDFKDALSATGLAGLYKAPVILTTKDSLNARARDELTRLKPSRVFIVGGTAAVSDNVRNEVKKLCGVTPKRLSGATSCKTSAAIAAEGRNSWSHVAIIATNRSYKDALSAAPMAYAGHMPIILADNGKRLDSAEIDAMKQIGITDAIIVGGKLAVTKDVEKQLGNAGISVYVRLSGNNALETSAKIARYTSRNGLSYDRMGIATSQDFPDALAGAALCGINRSVLLLADDRAMQNTDFVKGVASQISAGYVFGGPLAVGDKTMKALENATK
jgi:lactocepin